MQLSCRDYYKWSGLKEVEIIEICMSCRVGAENPQASWPSALIALTWFNASFLVIQMKTAPLSWPWRSPMHAFSFSLFIYISLNTHSLSHTHFFFASSFFLSHIPYIKNFYIKNFGPFFLWVLNSHRHYYCQIRELTALWFHRLCSSTKVPSKTCHGLLKFLLVVNLLETHECTCWIDLFTFLPYK